MNRALMIALLRQRLASPMRLLLLFFAFFPPIGMATLTMSLSVVNSLAYFFALVLAAGAIGQDVSSGVLQLTFARPVTRPAYVISRWFAAAAGAATLAIAQLLIATALLAARGALPGALDLLSFALADIVAAATGAAVMIGLSSLVGGLGDVALFGLATISLQVGHWIATLKGWTYVVTALAEIQRTIQPAISFGWIAGRGAPAWTDLVTAISTIVLGLCVAIVVVNRKELTYAAD